LRLDFSIFGLITLYQKGRRTFGLAVVRKEQVLGRIFSNLGQLETNAALVRWADEWLPLAPSWREFVSCTGQIAPHPLQGGDEFQAAPRI